MSKANQKIIALILVLFLTLFNKTEANTTIADSLIQVAQREKETFKIVDKLIEYSEEYCLSNSDLSRKLAEKSLELSLKVNYELGIGRSNSNISRTYLSQGDIEKAMMLINKAIALFEKNKNFSDLAHAHSLKSIIHGRLLQYNNAIEELNKAIEIYSRIGDSRGLQRCLLNLCVEYILLHEYNKALDVLTHVETLKVEIDNKKYYIPINYGSIYYETGNYFKALEFLEISLNGAKELNIPDAEVTSLHMIGLCQEKLGNKSKALQCFNDAISLAKLHKLDDETIQVLKDLTKFYEQSGDYQNAFTTYNEYIQLRDTIYSLDKINRIADLEKKLEVEKRENVIRIKNSEIEKGQAQVKAGVYKVYGISSAAILLLLVSIIVFKYYKKTKKLNAEISIQKLKVEEKNKDMMESITYAKRIQSSILPTDGHLGEIINNYFVLFKPRDIVSGDFYWAYKTPSNKIIFTVADCTGHGVPGALMSMVGNSLLNEIVIENEVEQSDVILNNLKSGIIKTFGQEIGKGTKDGMDMALCVWHRDSNLLEFSGANNSLYIIRNNEEELLEICKQESQLKYCGSGLLEIKASKQSVAFEEGKSNDFIKTTVKLKTDDMIYLFSDGFADQFGGPRDKKFTSKKFKEILIRISTLPNNIQLLELEKAFQAWKANNEQVDDVCVMGIKI